MNEEHNHGTELIGFWDLRAPGYSLATRISLNSEKRIVETLGHVIDLNNSMRVVDMGTGAGLMAIWLTQMGHDVTALDLSKRMIDLAERNARELGLSIDYRIMDAQNPELPEASYDLVVARSVLWCLEDPVGAYERWLKLLKPGGHMAILDGNYYLDLFDEDYRRRKQYLDLKNGVDNNLHAKTNIGGVDLNIIRKLAYELPLTRERRPTWDVSTLLGLGMTDIHVLSLDSYSYSVLTENGFMKLPSNFIISAQKPYDDASPYDQEICRKPIDDSMLEKVARRVENVGTGGLQTLKAMADAKRMEIIIALMSGRMSVSQISVTVGASSSLVSHNLKIMKEAGIVESTKEGKEVKYSLVNPYVIRSILEMCNRIEGVS